MILIYGSASSGKSLVAEKVAVDAGKRLKAELIYMATMENSSDEAKLRIKHHSKMREGKGFSLIEEMYNPAEHVDTIKDRIVLIECMSNLVGNVLFKEFGDNPINDAQIKLLSKKIVDEIILVSDMAVETVIVSNDVFSDGIKYDSWTEGYLKLLASVNIKLAEKSSNVIQVVNGCLDIIKGDKFEYN